MVKIKVQLQNGKSLETEVDVYDAVALTNEINSTMNLHAAIGDLVVHKHHIEFITEIKETEPTI